jgi:hypothetical protein
MCRPSRCRHATPQIRAILGGASPQSGFDNRGGVRVIAQRRKRRRDGGSRFPNSLASYRRNLTPSVEVRFLALFEAFANPTLNDRCLRIPAGWFRRQAVIRR